MPKLISIQIGSPQHFGADPAQPLSVRPWRTAFFKTPVTGNVTVGPDGIAGDGQADLKNHGGTDKAVCVYPVQHFDYWKKFLNRHDVSPGAFGENFSVAGLDESTVAIGDRWKIGTATFEVSQPRQPCWKLARRWQNKMLTAETIATGKTGWYLRTVSSGSISPNAEIVVLTSPKNAQRRFTIADANHVFYHTPDDLESTQQLISTLQLSVSWRSELQRRLS